MKVAIGSDEKTSLTDFVVEELMKRGHEVELFGILKGKPLSWVEVGEEVALSVSKGYCEAGILFCWTGTGVSIAANKVPGIRAALCFDAEMAQGARKWNHANILVMSLRLTSEPLASEILEAWFGTEWGGGEDAENVARLMSIEKKYKSSLGHEQLKKR